MESEPGTAVTVPPAQSESPLGMNETVTPIGRAKLNCRFSAGDTPALLSKVKVQRVSPPNGIVFSVSTTVAVGCAKTDADQLSNTKVNKRLTDTVKL